MATVAFDSKRTSDPAPAQTSDTKLEDLLTETRILLPGTQVFLGFLTTLPFANRFGDLDLLRRATFICTFIATVLALVLFVVPAAYHRLSRPIEHKKRFKAFANRFLIAGLVPLSISMVLTTYLITFMVMRNFALLLAGVIALLIAAVWWAAPLLRLHDRLAPADPPAARRPADGRAGA
jgi:hypothetical protein